MWIEVSGLLAVMVVLLSLLMCPAEGPQRDAADARAKYADVEAVIDEIRQAGIRDVTFLTQNTER
jgi:biopolymer transport protein ExbD